MPQITTVKAPDWPCMAATISHVAALATLGAARLVTTSHRIGVIGDICILAGVAAALYVCSP